MLELQVIGNLGADAQVKEANGSKFVSFNVAHTERWTDAAGVSHESTTWVSCAWSGDGGKALPYLVSGQKVFVSGRASQRIYSSPTEKKMVPGLNLSVTKLEFIGAAPDAIPHQLYDFNGNLVETVKVFCITEYDLKRLGDPKKLYDRNGHAFSVDGNIITQDEANNQ